MVEPSSAIWGYGFGRLEAEIEARRRAKRFRKKKAEPMLTLENFEIKELKATVTVKNIDKTPASIYSILLLKILTKPEIVEKKSLLGKEIMVKVAELISRDAWPNIFTIPPGETFTFSINLTQPLEENQSYMLELHMDEHKIYNSEIKETFAVKLGWAYLIRLFKGEIEKISTMNLEQAGDFWGKLIAQAKGEEKWTNIYYRHIDDYYHYPYKPYITKTGLRSLLTLALLTLLAFSILIIPEILVFIAIAIPIILIAKIIKKKIKKG